MVSDVVKVEPRDGYRVWLQFRDGVEGEENPYRSRRTCISATIWIHGSARAYSSPIKGDTSPGTSRSCPRDAVTLSATRPPSPDRGSSGRSGPGR